MRRDMVVNYTDFCRLSQTFTGTFGLATKKVAIVCVCPLSGVLDNPPAAKSRTLTSVPESRH